MRTTSTLARNCGGAVTATAAGERQREQRADHGSASKVACSAAMPEGRRQAWAPMYPIQGSDRSGASAGAFEVHAGQCGPRLLVCPRQRPQPSDADAGRLRAGPVLLGDAVGGDGVGDAALPFVDVGEEERGEIGLARVRLEAGDADEVRFRLLGAAEPKLQARQPEVRLEDRRVVDEQRLVDTRGDLDQPSLLLREQVVAREACRRARGRGPIGRPRPEGAQLLERAARQAHVDVRRGDAIPDVSADLRGLEGLDGGGEAVRLTEILQRPQRQVTALRGDPRERSGNVAVSRATCSIRTTSLSSTVRCSRMAAKSAVGSHAASASTWSARALG